MAATTQPLNSPATTFAIPYPMLWLALAVVVVYFSSFSFGTTDLDDTIFIRDFRAYNEDLGNLITSFRRGLFDAVKDPYFRPLFLDSMILNYHLSDQGQSIVSYHVINVLLHLASVLLLYKLFRKLGIRELFAFLLTLIFAVHPVLSQAVAWIPGRNDTMLTVFILSFLICTINYTKDGNIRSLAFATLFLLLAFFTKETAVFVAPVAFTVIVLLLQKNWLDRRNLIQYGIWVGCFLLWYFVRAQATIQTGGLAPGQVATKFLHRLPLIVQYLGKMFLPVNLSVFPIQEDTVYYYGIIAIILVAVLLFLNKLADKRVIGAGFTIFLLFLLPVLLVPSSLNEQTFEHRLYLPMIGILLVLSQSVLLHNKFRDKQIFTGAVTVAAILAIINFNHQQAFATPLSFWTEAARTSPHSAYANMMLAAREDDLQTSYSLFRKAYQLNPKEKYLNFYYGVMLQKQDSVLQSEKYLLAERNSSGYYECDFYLARVAMEKKDPNGAISYLQTYLKKDPTNKIANTNLLLLYMDTQQRDKAAAHAKEMLQSGLDVPATIRQQLGV